MAVKSKKAPVKKVLEAVKKEKKGVAKALPKAEEVKVAKIAK
jgi:hypothetical protein